MFGLRRASSAKGSARSAFSDLKTTTLKDGAEQLAIEQALVGIERYGGKQARQAPRCRLLRLARKFDRNNDGKLRLDEYQDFLEYLERGHMVQDELNEMAVALEAAEQQVAFHEKRGMRRSRSATAQQELGELQAGIRSYEERLAEAQRKQAAAEQRAAADVAAAAAALIRAEQVAAGEAPEKLPPATDVADEAPTLTDADGQLWRARTWLTSLPLMAPIAAALLRPLHAVAERAAAEFEYTRSLREEDVAHLLRDAQLGGLAPCILAGLRELQQQAAATGHELAAKFAVSAQFELAFGGIDIFFGGLERLVGPPALIEGSLLKAMAFEHEGGADADEPFTSSNGLTSTSRAEWGFVAAPQPDVSYPERAAIRSEWRRKPMALDELVRRMHERNAVLRGAGHTELILEEVVGCRLYSGPLYEKYNAVLRSQSGSPFLVAKFDRLCAGNFYRTTLHAINSCVVKLSKVQPVCKLYRGFTDGTEYAFMSSTTVREQAVAYAEGKASTIFELHQGMVDRGASIAFLSQYEHEAEVLMPPLCGLEVTGTRVEGQSLVVECQLSLNLLALTLEAVVSKRRQIVADMCTNMQLELRNELRADNRTGQQGAKAAEAAGWPELRALCGDFDVDELAVGMLDETLQAIRSHEVEFFNDDGRLSKAVQAAVHATSAVKGWPAALVGMVEQEVSLEEDCGDSMVGVLGVWLRCEGGAKVRDLNLASCKLTDVGLAHLCLALQQSAASVRSIDIGTNQIESLAPLQRLAMESQALCQCAAGCKPSARPAAEWLDVLMVGANPLRDFSPLAEAMRARALPKLRSLVLLDCGDEHSLPSLLPGLVPGATDALHILSLHEVGRHAPALAEVLRSGALKALRGVAEAVRHRAYSRCSPREWAHSSAPHAARSQDAARHALRELYIESCKLDAQGAALLLRAMAAGATAALRCLSMDQNTEVGDEGGVELAAALRAMPDLQKLDAAGCGMGGATARALADAVEHGALLKVRTLNLGENKLGAGFAPLGAALARVAPVLEQLCVEDNALPEEGVCALAEALRASPSLTRLELGDNALPPRAAGALAAVLPSLGALTTLALQRCALRAAGAEKIAAAANALGELTTLDMSGCTFARSAEARRAVLAACAERMSAGMKVHFDEDDDEEEEDEDY